MGWRTCDRRDGKGMPGKRKWKGVVRGEGVKDK